MSRCDERQIPNDEEEVNTREIHKCDGQAHDPDTMVAPLTPKPKRKDEVLAKAPLTIVSRLEEDAALKKWPKPRLCCANGILETKANDGSTAAKARPHLPTQIHPLHRIFFSTSSRLQKSHFAGFARNLHGGFMAAGAGGVRPSTGVCGQGLLPRQDYSSRAHPAPAVWRVFE